MKKNKPKKQKTKIKEKANCEKHKWIPLAGNDKGKKVPTALFTCLNCGEMKVGTHTIKISRYRLDMGELPINSVAGIKLMKNPSADLTASGLIMTATVDTNAQGIGAPLFMAADGNLDTADADTNATSPCVALALETGTGSKKILVHGVLRVDAWNWTTGPGSTSLVYVSTSVGTLTQDLPLIADNVVQPVGFALTADSVYFSPSMFYLTVPTTPFAMGDRGIFIAGENSSWAGQNVIDYINIVSAGNATDFGDMLGFQPYLLAACTNGSRAIINDASNYGNSVSYITIASTSNATDFGDLTVGRFQGSALSDTTRGIFCCGSEGPFTYSNVMDYFTIATLGNASDFGDNTAIRRHTASCASSTRGICAGASDTNVIDYITIATTGNATDFGDIITSPFGAWAGCSNLIKGIFYGHGNNIIEYITISTLGNAADFGDLTQSISQCSGCSNGTIGVRGGGYATTFSNVIDNVTISTSGNAADFGDLTMARFDITGCSGN